MGLFVVLIFWAVAGVVLGSISAGALAAIAALLTRGVAQGRRKLIITAALLPFACLAWAGAIFVFQALVNEGLLHRDLGLGDGGTRRSPMVMKSHSSMSPIKGASAPLQTVKMVVRTHHRSQEFDLFK